MKGQIKYERQLQNTYITIDTVNEEIVDSFVGQIILRNCIQGFADSRIIQIDGGKLAQYDISNCQDISTAFSAKKLSKEELEGIIESLNLTILEMEKYLMDGLQLILNPGFIYTDMETKKIKFLFDFSERRHKSDIVELGKFFIDNIDHEDEEAIKLAYYFFEIAQTDNYSVERMENYLDECEKKEKTKQREKSKDIRDISGAEQTYNQYNKTEDILERDLNRDDALEYLYGDNQEFPEEAEITDESWFRKILNLFKHKEKKRKNGEKTQYEYYNEEIGRRDDTEENEQRQTVYIGKSAHDRDYSLVEVRKGKEIFHKINTYPFTLGSQKDSVNLYIKDSSVSRIHGKISKTEEGIYIEDLHSTNGTMINDLPLLPHEKNKIRRGDIITLGKSEFEFR